MTNFKAAGVVLEDYDWCQRKKLFKEANQYVWDDPHLFKIGADKEQLLKPCKLDSFNPPSSRMQMSMSRGVTIVRELGASPKRMKCL